MAMHKHKFDVPIAWEEYLDNDICRTVRSVTKLRCDCGEILTIV